jgi:hypothetical protein
MRDLSRSVCSCSPTSLLWTSKDFMSGMKAFWGARLMALPSASGCLGASRFETFLRLACLEWLCQTLYSYARYLDVSTLHTFKINIISPASPSFVSTTTEDLFTRCAFQDPAGYPRILDIVDLRPLRGRHAYKASFRSALPDSLQLL